MDELINGVKNVEGGDCSVYESYVDCVYFCDNPATINTVVTKITRIYNRRPNFALSKTRVALTTYNAEAHM